MLPLNAIDALGPAFTRTHQTLFQPFRMGRSWKLAASQYLGWCGSMFVPFFLVALLIPSGAFHGFAAARVILFAITGGFTLLHLVVLYFCARMELVAFEMLVTRAKFVAPMWRRYSNRIWPWLGFKILVGTVFTTLILALLYAPIRHLIARFAALPLLSLPHDATPDPAAVQAIMGQFFAQIFGLEVLLIAIAFVLKIPSTLLNDFVLPFYVLEDVSVGTAITRGLRVMAADPVQTILYLIIKPVLFVIGYIMQSIALQVAMIPIIIVMVIVGAIVGAIAGVAGATLHNGGAGLGLLAIAGIVVFSLFFFVFIMYATIFTVGYLIALLEAYGIYFLGGRYPLLGNMLEPGPGAPFTPPPVFPADDELEDEDGGPPMPMDPAVA